MFYVDPDPGVHLALAAAIAVPCLMIFGLWFDWRKQKRYDAIERSKIRDEQKNLADQRHHENVVRMTALETKIDPIVEWWNDVRNGRRRP